MLAVFGSSAGKEDFAALEDRRHHAAGTEVGACTALPPGVPATGARAGWPASLMQASTASRSEVVK